MISFFTKAAINHIKIMESVAFKVEGKVKSRIKCRAYAELNFKELKQLDDEFRVQVADLMLEDKDKPFPELIEAQNVCIELYSKEPDIEMIRKYFIKERDDATKYVKHFEFKVAELKKDPNVPKITKNDTGGNDTDYTTLEGAKKLLFDYNNRFNFINECIFEIGIYQAFDSGK